MQSYRRECRKFRFVNSAPADWGTRTASAGSPLTGGRFSLNLSGECAYPAGAQEGRHLRFPPSCESPLSLGGSGADCRHVTAAKWGNDRGFFLPCLSQPIRSVGYRTATQVGYFQQARHTRAAQLVSLEVTDSTYESIYLVAFILAGAVYNNALKNRAALSCRACLDEITCVAVMYLTLRIG